MRIYIKFPGGMEFSFSKDRQPVNTTNVAIVCGVVAFLGFIALVVLSIR